MALDEFSIPSAVSEKLKDLGYQVSDSMSEHIRQWYSWYTNENKFYKVAYISTARRKKERDRYSLRPARKICREWASLILNEETEISVDDESANAWLKDYLDRTGFWLIGQMIIEKSFAMGTGALVLWYDMMDGEVSSIKIRRYDARMIVPLSWDDDEVTECAFVTRVTVKGKKYDQLQIHAYDQETDSYHIRTFVFNDDKEEDAETLGFIADFDTEQKCKTFGIVKPGLDNVVADNSPFGISVFYDSIDAIKATDLAWDSIFQEVDLTKVRVFLADEMLDLKDEQGNKVPIADLEDQIYRMVYAGGDGKLIDVFSPDIRIEPLKDALNIALAELGDNSGFGEQYFQIGKTGGLMTATEVVSDNSALMRNVRKHENSVGDAIKDVITGLLSSAASLGYAEFNGEVGQVSIKFDDSVITDTQTEKNQMLAEIAAGVVPKWKYLETFYGMSENEAKAEVDDGIIGEGF